ncbi:MAG: PEGA domain-containing protein [Candidatus Latescibacteria bacterium]|nr:PEGA domain-containing protein [Candidatus Latescibacterota bacterium]
MKVLLTGLIVFSLIYAVEMQTDGYLTVNSHPFGLKIYLEGEFIGLTPIQNFKLAPGSYSVSLFSSDTIEQKYWNLANAGVCGKLSALSELSKAGAGTQQVEIQPNHSSEVFFSLQKVNRAPTRLKLGTTCCVGTGFSLAFILGYLVAISASVR